MRRTARDSRAGWALVFSGGAPRTSGVSIIGPTNKWARNFFTCGSTTHRPHMIQKALAMADTKNHRTPTIRAHGREIFASRFKIVGLRCLLRAAEVKVTPLQKMF